MPRSRQTTAISRRLHLSVFTALTLLLSLLASMPGMAQPPMHATPAPGNTPYPMPPTGMPPQPFPGGIAPGGRRLPGSVRPGAPVQATPSPAPGQTPAPGAAPTPAVVPSPTTAPQVVYEGSPAPGTAGHTLAETAPTTQSVRKIGGATGGEQIEGGTALPTTAPEQPKLSIRVRGKSVDEIFNTIREKTGVRVKAMGAVGQKKMDLNLPETPVETILNQIAQANGWVWVQQADGSYEMYDQESFKSFRSQQVRIKSYQLHFIDADEMLKVVQPLLTPEIGAVAADARSNKLIVTDLPSKLALVESILREYDIQVYTHVFEIKNVPVDQIREQLDQVKSKAGEMFVDPISRTIIVKDTFDKIKMMEQLVQILDRDIETRVYNLTNLGIDNEAVDEFISKFIEPLKSQSDTAVMEYNKYSGKLVVRDVRAVQDKILAILRQVDTPRKQVRIEGEIVSVVLSHNLSIGTEWSYSHDLQKAFANPVTGSIGTSNTTFNTAGLPFITGGAGGLKVLEMTDNIKAQLNATLSDSRTRLLLRPRITIANNEEGMFNVTQDQPVLQTYNYGGFVNSVNNQASGQTTYRSGLQVRIRPTISNRGLIEMEIEFINSTPLIVPDIGNGIRGVGSTEESANTVLIVPSGETRVLGGLISRNNDSGHSGIPYLAQIPYLGFLFGKKTDDSTMRNLMFFITPTIVEEQPLNDLVVEPVNEVAQASMAAAQQAAAPAPQVGEIPPELRPYLKELQPEALPLPGTAVTTGTAAVSPSEGVVSDETPISSEALSSGAQLLSNEPPPELRSSLAPGELRMGGALAQAGGKTLAGPSGVFAPGGTAGGAAKGGPAAATARVGTKAGTTRAGGTAGTQPGGRAPRPDRSSRLSGRDRGSYSMRGYTGMQGYGGGSSFQSETRY